MVGVRNSQKPLSQVERLEAWLVCQMIMAKNAQQVLGVDAAGKYAHMDSEEYEESLLRMRRMTVLSCADSLWALFLKVD